MKSYEILKPKTEREIWERINLLNPNEMLLACARGGFLPGVKKALDDGADINFLEAGDTCSALANSLEQGFFNIAQLLLEQGAFISNTALIYSFKNKAIFIEMLKKVDVKACYGLKLAQYTAQGRNLKDIASLILYRVRQDGF